MNVYSVRLIPQLKIKFCEFLGIASHVAVNQLGDRLYRLERAMDRFETQIRRVRRRQLVLETQAAPKEEPPSFKKPTPRKKKTQGKASGKRKKSVKKSLLQEIPRQDGVPANVTNITAAVNSTADEGGAKVLVVRGDAETLEAVREYFGEGISLKNLETLQDLESMENDQEVLALFFDRTLLGQAGVRKTLEDWGRRFPKARMVGLSSYLTLSLAQSVPSPDEFATFLTKPLTPQSLAELFEEKSAQAIS